MNLGKIGFFKRIYLALTDFRMYPYAQKEKLSIAIGYFFKLLIVVSLILGTLVTINIFDKIPFVLDLYNKYMPDFEVTNGLLSAESVVQNEINSDYYLIVDSNYKYSEIQNISLKETETHNYYILVLSDASVLAVRMNDGIHELGIMQYEPNMNFDKQELAKDVKLMLESSKGKLSTWLGMSLGIFVVLAIIRLWTLIMYIISAYIINFMFGLKLKISEYLKIVIYTSTLPIILEIIALGVVGSISETVNFLSVLISCVYIFYALRAIKLDSLILGGSGKTAEEKIKNALAHAQEELEKQLSEIEKKEENEKSEERKDIEELSKALREKEENLIKAQREYQEVIKKAMNLNNEGRNNNDIAHASGEDVDKTTNDETKKSDEEKHK